jgi:hypothetical protein
MLGLPLRVPYLANQFVLDPGPQPINPGQSDSLLRAALNPYTIKPWPIVVGTISALLSSPGTPRARAPVPVVNQYGPGPANYLFIGGFVSKSKG